MYCTGNKTDASNMVFQLPYVVEVYNYVKGIRTHPIRVQANDRTVMVSNASFLNILNKVISITFLFYNIDD